MRTFLIVTFSTCLLLCLSTMGLIWAALDKTAVVSVQSHQQVEDADSVKQLLNVIRRSLVRRRYAQNIALNQTQLNSLMGLANRARQEFSGQVALSTQIAMLKASYQLPANPFGNYLNFSAEVLPGEGLQLGQVKLGSVHIPGDWLLNFATWFVNLYTDSNLGTETFKQIERIVLLEQTAVVVLRPLDDFLAKLEQIKDQFSDQDNEPLRARTAYYLKYLSELPETQLFHARSLSLFIGKLFEEVAAVSHADTASFENEAAIMALAIFAGNYRFAAFVGDVQPLEGRLARPVRATLLANRVDLSQHFIYSAAIKILSEQGISAAIGEFKELMDRGDGGSGYSFPDLAADLAGIKFAAVATDPLYARQFQQKLALASTLGEELLFPETSDLPEGLGKQAFEKQFARVDSPEYQAMVETIEQRIAELPVYSALTD